MGKHKRSSPATTRQPSKPSGSSRGKDAPSSATGRSGSAARAGLDWLERSPLASSALLAALTALLLLPFVGKAFHIDDTLFLKAARQIAEKPLDPYGFKVIWYVTEMPMFEVTKNPPLASYYIALAGRHLGWSEVPLHLAFILPAMGVVLGTFFLARRMCQRPLLAGVAALSAPAFLVSSTTVMCDTMMLAFWVWAVFLWMEGMDREDPVRLGGSAILVAASALTKYFGISLIPLLALYSLLHKRRVGVWAGYLAIPVVALAGYHWWTASLYGRGLLSDAASYATQRSVPGGNIRWTRALVGLAFTGGCALPALLYAPRIWPARLWIAGLLVAAGVGTAAGAGGLASSRVSFPDAWAAPGGLHFALFTAGGLSVLALAVADLRRRRDPGSLLLAAWLAGTFLFASFVNWSVNARSVLPIVPAVAVLLARRLEAGPSRPAWQKRIADFAPALAAAAIALWVASADTKLANSARTAAAFFQQKTRGEQGTLWFQGHWGFQNYMEAIGAHPIDVSARRLRSGDLVVIPLNNTNTFPFRQDQIASQEPFDFPIDAWLATMRSGRAGFYADVWGPLPFSFGAVPAERYLLLRLEAQVPANGPAPPR